MSKQDGQNLYNQRLQAEAHARDLELLALSEGLPVAELARRLKVSRSWLYHRLQRARRTVGEQKALTGGE